MTGPAAARADRIASRLAGLCRSRDARNYLFSYLTGETGLPGLLDLLERAADRTEAFLARQHVGAGNTAKEGKRS